MQLWQKLLAEVFGTMVLVGFGTGTILAALATETPLQAAVPLGFGLALLVGLYAVGEVSGGHFNPAVTLAAFFDRRISFGDLVGYWTAQFAGAVLGSWFVAILVNRVAVSQTFTFPGVDNPQAFLGEVVFTAVFVFLILAVTTGGHTGQAFVAISLGLAAVHFIGVPLTGASVNPVRSFAPFIIGDFPGGYPSEIWIYLTAPLVGAIVGWVLFMVIVTGDMKFGDDLKGIRDAVVE